MNDKAVDKRLNEIEDDIRLLSGYLSADIEEKMQGMLGDVRTGIDGLRKTIVSMPQPSAKGDKAPQVNVGAIEASVLSLMDAAERSEKSLSRLEEAVGAKDLKDSGSLARHLHDVSSKLLQGIKAIDEGMKKRPQSVATEAGSITVDLSELLDTLNKAESSLAESADETRKLLSQGFDSVRDNLLSEVATLRETVDKGLAETGKSLKNAESLHDDFKKALATSQTDLKKDIDSHTQLLKTGMASANETLKKELTDSQNTIGTGIVRRLEALKSDIAGGLDELKSGMAENRETLQKDITAGQKEFQQNLTVGIGKAITANIGDSIGTISDSIDKLTKEIPASTGNIMHGVTSLDKKLSDLDKEVKELIERDHGNIKQIGEYLKKLGTSEEISAAREDVSSSLEKLDTLLEQLAIVYSNIKQRLELHEKLVTEGKEQNLTKQDEIKKMVMYDLNTINETTSSIKSMCSTGTGNIGNLVADISGHTSGMAEIVPKMMETVSKQAEQLDRVSAEVRMMRWFVIGAVGVSLVTLIASFFI